MALTLKVKYFVPFDRLMGTTETVQLPEGGTVRDLLAALAGRSAGLGELNLKDQLIIIRNGAICSRDGRLADGDEISILTPQLGG